MPLRKWHVCKECGKTTIVLAGQYGSTYYSGDFCAICYRWKRRGYGPTKVGTHEICPETGVEIPYLRDRSAQRKYKSLRIGAIHRRNKSWRKATPERREERLEYMRKYNARRTKTFRENGLCPVCGGEREELEFKLCGSCRERARDEKRRNKCY